jgi:DNA-binding transcriptional LysR family regulator
MESLTGIIAFVQSAETLSFVAAGRALGVSASAVGKNVARLEESLGVRLLHRTTRRISLTEEGLLFQERCRRILEDLREAKMSVSLASQVPRGKLRVSLPIIGYRFLVTTLPEFRRLYPAIELELDFSDRLVDVVEEGFDAVIRSGPLADSTLASRRLGPFHFRLCASPGYLRRKGTPRTPADLAAHDALHFRFPSTGKLQEWAFVQELPASAARPATVLTCNNLEALRAAALEGLGIAYMPDFLVRDAIESHALRAVLDRYLVNPGQFSILWPSNRHVSSKLRVFIDFLTQRVLKSA